MNLFYWASARFERNEGADRRCAGRELETLFEFVSFGNDETEMQFGVSKVKLCPFVVC